MSDKSDESERSEDDITSSVDVDVDVDVDALPYAFDLLNLLVSVCLTFWF